MVLRPPRFGLALVAVALLAGCGAQARASGPTWVPQPSFAEGQAPTIQPVQPPHPSPSAPPESSNSPTGPSTTPSPSNSNADPAVVATHLAAPTGLALLPDGTALVGERTTGRIVRVQPRPGQPVTTVRTLAVTAVGGGGLLDLALSPHYSQDNLIFAYLTTATDNRVVAFTMTGPVTPVLTGIARGASGNAGRISFGAGGTLYVGTGDAGQPPRAADLNALSGKVLRISDIGEPAPNNPVPTSPVFTSGHRAVAGLCIEPHTGSVLEVGPGASAGVVNRLVAGATYGWPHPSASDRPPLALLPAAYGSPGDCAVLQNTLYVTSLDGHALLAAPLSVTGSSITIGKFTASYVNTYGRLLTVVASTRDGALWLTTANKDGLGHPIPDDERVIRIVMSGAAGNSPV